MSVGAVGGVSGAGSEVELKLAGRFDEIVRVMESDPVRSALRGPAVRLKLHATYYDTEDRRLKSRGVSFRVRSDGGGWVQTLKTDSGSGSALMTRGEWELRLTSPAPRPDAFAEPEARRALGLVLPGEIRSAFHTEVERIAGEIEWPDPDGGTARAALAVDRGVVSAGKRRTQVAEVEIERIEGSEAALWDFAEVLGEITPLRPHRQAKSQRGWALVTGEAPAAQRAGRVELDESASLEEGMRRILSSGLAHWLDNEPVALDGRSADGVHQMRVALRRLRSALSLFRPFLGEAERTGFADDLRRIIQSLAAARDLDVLRADVIGEPLEAMPGRAALERLAAVVDDERRKAYETVRTTLAEPDYARALLRFAVWIGARRWRRQAEPERLRSLDEPLREHARRLLDKRRKTVLKRGRDFAALDAYHRHELRIALKKLRYAGEFFQSLYPQKASSKYLGRVADMQDRLGRLNDASVAADALRSILDRQRGRKDLSDLAIAAGEVVGWHGRAAADSEPELEETWQALAELKPYWH